MKQNSKAETGGAEWRCYTGQEFRAAENENGEKTIEGHAAVYNRTTQIGCWFKEIIEPGAFDNADMTDVPLLVNHDMRKIPLARSRRNNGNSTMRLSTDATGLLINARLDAEKNAEAEQLFSAIKRGDVDGMSFSFSVAREEWDDLDSDMPTRRIKEFAKIYEVSAVTWPAYTDTDIHARAGNPPDGGRLALENARQKALLDKGARQSVDTDGEIEKYKLRIGILGGI